MGTSKEITVRFSINVVRTCTGYADSSYKGKLDARNPTIISNITRSQS